jgi:hypothetical protein
MRFMNVYLSTECDGGQPGVVLQLGHSLPTRHHYESLLSDCDHGSGRAHLPHQYARDPAIAAFPTGLDAIGSIVTGMSAILEKHSSMIMRARRASGTMMCGWEYHVSLRVDLRDVRICARLRTLRESNQSRLSEVLRPDVLYASASLS